jgi:hypothetical protein
MKKITVKQEGVEDFPRLEVESISYDLASLGGVLEACDFQHVLLNPNFSFSSIALMIQDFAARLYHANYAANHEGEVDRCAFDLYNLGEVLYWTDLNQLVDRETENVKIKNFSLKPVGKIISGYADRIMTHSLAGSMKDHPGLTFEEIKKVLVDTSRKGMDHEKKIDK